VPLDAALEASAAAGLPPHRVAPNQGKLLELLARIQGARTILEIGRLGRCSTIWLARALPEGRSLVTLEADPPHYAEVARGTLARAALADVVDLRAGRALDTLSQLEGPFDLIFFDADKRSNPEYFYLRFYRSDLVRFLRRSTTTSFVGPCGNTNGCAAIPPRRAGSWPPSTDASRACSPTGDSARAPTAGRWEPGEREVHAGFCERRGVRLPPATHPPLGCGIDL
jgi:hypothetical protein